MPSAVIPSVLQGSIEAIIFDLDGVVCKTSTLKVVCETGLLIMLKAIVEQGSPYLREQLFAALTDAKALSLVKSYHKGLAMPAIMVDWQCGLQDLVEIQRAMIGHIQRLTLSEAQKKLFSNMILWITNPDKFVNTRCVIKEGVKLLHDLKEKGYKLYVLSNWDPFSFDAFQRKFPEIFIHKGMPIFSGIMTSGQMKLLKPDEAIYKACIDRFKLDPSQAILIDDTPENVKAAQNCGINAITCHNENFDEVRLQLVKMLV